MNAEQDRSRPSWLAVLAVYGGGFIIGATLDSFPASSAYLIAQRGLSDSQYGAIYIPQLVAAIVGAIAGGIASRHFALRRLFEVGAAFLLLAQALLAFCGWPGIALDSRIAWLLVMAATATFGFGFGFGGGPLNGLVALLFPKTPNTAITAFHMCAGAGLALAPLIFSKFAAAGHWTAGILSLCALTVLVLVLALCARLPGAAPATGTQAAASATVVRDKVFWILVAAAIAYALVEGTFSNWAVLFVQDDLRMSAGTAAGALTAFWGGLTIGRLGISVIALRVKPIVFLCVLPFCMIAALLLLRAIDSPSSALAGFSIAGLSCSAFFPMLVGFSAEGHPNQVSWLAAMLTAALMTGVGIGSYAIGTLRVTTPIRDLYAGAVLYPMIALTAVLLALKVRHSKGR